MKSVSPFIIASVVLALAFVFPPSLRAEQSDFRAKTWIFSDLKEFFLMGTVENVRRAMGAPDAEESGDWIYHGIKVAAESGKVETAAVVLKWKDEGGRKIVGAVEIQSSKK